MTLPSYISFCFVGKSATDTLEQMTLQSLVHPTEDNKKPLGSGIKPFDVVFLDRVPEDEEIEPLEALSKTYAFFVTQPGLMDQAHERLQFLFKSKMGKFIAVADVESFLNDRARNYFPKPYGEKFSPNNLSVVHGFSGKVFWNGSYSLCFDGDYGTELNQIAFWRNNIPVFAGQAIDLWLEYKKDDTVEVALKVYFINSGSIADVQRTWEFSEQEMQDIVTIDNDGKDGSVFMQVCAKGHGRLDIIALHDRYSRRGEGHFLPGGERYVSSDREEFFCYFEPGDMKPPLNVYFSGYKTQQGFEAYSLIKSMGCPFLLVTEPRLEGGCFYLGSREYEDMACQAIKKYIDKLGFSPEQVIFSGLSMGTFGALYYGCDIRPHAIILGKPLANIGTVAANNKYLRPQEFFTSLDVLNYLYSSLDEAAVDKLDDRFWKKFGNADWSHTKFAVAYMRDDDYDNKAYNMLISHLSSAGVQVYGKGIMGRHNDDTPAIVKWFVNQYKKIIREDFRG